MYISVIGASECDSGLSEVAYRVGWEIGRQGHVLVCGGLGGVMEASSHGAHDVGGLVVGILPGADKVGANKWLTIALPTEMGHARNALVARAGDALIAVGGGHGTLSEIAFGLKMGKPVIGIETWDLEDRGDTGPCVVKAETPEEAVRLAVELAG